MSIFTRLFGWMFRDRIEPCEPPDPIVPGDVLIAPRTGERFIVKSPEKTVSVFPDPPDPRDITISIGGKELGCELIKRNKRSVIVRLPDGNVIRRQNKYIVKP